MSDPPRIIARTQLRRAIRTGLADPTKVMTLGFLAIIGLGPLLIGLVFGAYIAGQAIAEGVVWQVGPPRIAAIVREAAVAVWLGLTGVAVLRGATVTGGLERPDLLLTSTSVRNIVIGIIYGEWLRFLVVMVPVAALAGVPIWAGSGLASVTPAIMLLLTLVALTAIPAGFGIGLGIRHLVTTYRPIAQLRVPILIALGAAYLAVLITDRFDPLVDQAAVILRASPLAWPAELVVAPIPGVAAQPLRVVGAVGISGLLLPILVSGAVHVATIHWFRDRSTSSGGLRWAVFSLDPLERSLVGRVPRPTVTICVTALRRLKRAPARLVYVAYPLLGSVVLVLDWLRRGELPFLAFILLAVYVIWASGAVVALNPLGDLGGVMPTVLTSPLTGREAIGGFRLAAWLLGVPLIVLIVLVAGLSASTGPVHLGLFALAAMVGVLLAPSLALGVGAMFPRFGAVRITNRRDAVMPSKLAYSVYSSLLSIPTTAFIVLGDPWLAELLTELTATVLRRVLPEAAPVAVWVVRLIVGVPALLAIPLALFAFRFACYRFDRYALP